MGMATNAYLLRLQAIEGVLAEAAEEDKQCWADQLSDKGSFTLTVNNAEVELTSSMIEFKSEQKKETGRLAAPLVVSNLIVSQPCRRVT